MRKRILAVLAAIAIGVTGAVVAASPAQADPTCPAYRICWFDANNWQGTKYVVNPSSFIPGHCYNMGIDGNTGINWDRLIDSVWWNEIVDSTTYAELYSGWDCTIAKVTRVYAWPSTANQMHRCTEPFALWNGPCGPPNNVSQRIRSWAFTWGT